MGHFISDEKLIKLAHQMICMMLASYDFPSLYREEYSYHDSDPLDDLRQFEDSDFSENLVMLSALARVNDDEIGTLKSLEKNFPEGVGKLTENGKVIALTPREACNKVIHANTISFELNRSKEHPIWWRYFKKQGYDVEGNYKDPLIIIEGERQNGKPWKAEINAINFLLSVSIEYGKWNLA